MEIEKVRKTIAALQARTVESGFTEAEALAAVDQAQRLMERYGVSMADISVSGSSDFEDYRGCARRRTEVFESILYEGVGDFCGVIAYVSRVRCPVDGASSHGCFFGYRADVEMAVWLFDMLRDTALRELKRAQSDAYNYGRGRSYAVRIKRRDFLIGFAVRIGRRLDEMAAARKGASSGARALVVAKGAAVSDAAKSAIGTLGVARAPSPPRDFRSLRVGEAAGDRVSISRPIEPGAEAVAALLPPESVT